MNAGGRPERVRYEYRGAVLEGPPGWEEESLLTLTVPSKGKATAVGLIRMSVPPDVPIEVFGARKIAQLSAGQIGLEVQEALETTVNGRRAVLYWMSWPEGEARIVQQVLFIRGDRDVFALTGTAVDSQLVTLQIALARALRSLHVTDLPSHAIR